MGDLANRRNSTSKVFTLSNEIFLTHMVLEYSLFIFTLFTLNFYNAKCGLFSPYINSTAQHESIYLFNWQRQIYNFSYIDTYASADRLRYSANGCMLETL